MSCCFITDKSKHSVHPHDCGLRVDKFAGVVCQGRDSDEGPAGPDTATSSSLVFITYTIILRNTGKSQVSNLQIYDNLAAVQNVFIPADGLYSDNPSITPNTPSNASMPGNGALLMSSNSTLAPCDAAVITVTLGFNTSSDPEPNPHDDGICQVRSVTNTIRVTGTRNGKVFEPIIATSDTTKFEPIVGLLQRGST